MSGEVRRLQPTEIEPAAQLIAEGMSENPIHRAAIRDPDARRRLLALALAHNQTLPGRWAFGYFERDRLLAVAGVAENHACRPSGESATRLHARVAETVSEDDARRYAAWRGAWRRHDPAVPHWHFGPFAVVPERRGDGIGSAVLDYFCSLLDAAGAHGYLEADDAANLPLYRRRGFAVVAEEEVLGVANWFLLRSNAF